VTIAKARKPSLRGHEPATFYVKLLTASAAINLFSISIDYKDTRHFQTKLLGVIPYLHHPLTLTGLVAGAILIALGIKITLTFPINREQARRSLARFGALASIYLLLNLLIVSYGIWVFKVQSYLLLLSSICAYISVNIIFAFWYWYVDFPTQVQRLHHPLAAVELSFPQRIDPEELWLPDFLDYLYFTVNISNTFGSPENHSPYGKASKTIMIIHASTMMVLLVIFVSRAINTLS
jgi:hypothetical protein